jgi:hypothetical protein
MVELGSVIARRELYVEGEPERTITVLMGQPQTMPELPGEYYCPLQVLGAGDESVRRAYGIDAFEAIQNGLMMLASVLYRQISRELGGRLRWRAAAGESLGFPMPESASDFDPRRDPPHR